ncbi:MAG: hypothetical protein MJA83_17835, partial [Gammaproteobacteria bacterium]|nr:hypothetical protein [Gammaproteobacteria bacterium]
STRRTTYGETERKGYTLVEFHHHDGELTDTTARRWGPCDWRFIEAPAQRMILIEDEWGSMSDWDRRDPELEPFDDEGDGWLVGHIEGIENVMRTEEAIRGADIRLRYKVTADKREAAAIAAAKWERDLLEQGADRVKVEEKVIPSKRPRAPEVAETATLADKMTAMWDHRGDVADDRRPRLLDKLHQLERRAQS